MGFFCVNSSFSHILAKSCKTCFKLGMLNVMEALENTQQTPLEELADVLHQDMESVNQKIRNRMQSDVGLINKIAHYLIEAGGKRIRPLLTLAFAKGLQGDMKRAHGMAATVEFIHTATLLHDDVVDESAERRGKAAANEIFGNQASVLVGDFLFSRSFQLMVADGSLKTLKILSDASAIIAEGEVMQLQMQRDLNTSWDQYLSMIGAKTAALFAAACEVGAVVSDADKDMQQSAYDYGYNLGIAFQIVDDVLDYSADQKLLGKEVGDDFHEGKISAPVLLAYQAADKDQKAFWQRTIALGDQKPEDLQHAQHLMQQHNIISNGLTKAKEYVKEAQKSLETLPPSTVKQHLHRVSEYVLHRAS